MRDKGEMISEELVSSVIRLLNRGPLRENCSEDTSVGF